MSMPSSAAAGQNLKIEYAEHLHTVW